MWLRFDGVDDVREFDGILDEEDRDVIANEIPDTLIRVKLHGEATNVAHGILERSNNHVSASHREQERFTYRTTLRSLHSAEPDENRRCSRRVSQHACLCPLLRAVIKDTEVPMRAGTAGMHDTLRDALVVKARDLLSCNLVLEKRWAWSVAVACSEPGMVSVTNTGERIDEEATHQLSVSETLTP